MHRINRNDVDVYMNGINRKDVHMYIRKRYVYMNRNEMDEYE